MPSMTSTPAARDKEGRYRQLREAMTPQRMNRLSTAHSAIENGLKYFIKRSGASYPHTHELRTLLDNLRACDPALAASLDEAFDAATEFYGTDTQNPDHCHLASLADYLDKSGTEEQFKRMRYVELESSIDDLALGCVHIDFHYEILCALDEAIQPRYGTIASRVEEHARLAFLASRRFDSLAAQNERSREAYVGWLEAQDSFVEAIRRLTASHNAIEDKQANNVAISVCYHLTGSEDLALRTIAFALIESGRVDLLAQRRDTETRVRRPQGAANEVVTTPAGDELGRMRHLATGFWLATDDPHDTNPEWFHTEVDARLYLAHLFLVEVPIVTARGSSCYRVVSPRPLRTRDARDGWSVASINWAGFVTDRIWLKLWESHNDFRVGEHIEIRANPESSLYWRGRVTDVAGQNLAIGETELLSWRR